MAETKQDVWKVDVRPPRGWWAPGKYLGKCRACSSTFIGDKRAGVCADCAYAAPDAPPAVSSAIPLVELRWSKSGRLQQQWEIAVVRGHDVQSIGHEWRDVPIEQDLPSLREDPTQ